jgi:tetratricopeptide (TPR) repeat protein
MRRSPASRLAPLVALMLLPPALARADTLALKDGRFVEGVAMEKKESGCVVLHYKAGDVTVPADKVSDVLIEKQGAYEPRNDEEKAQLEKGLLPYEGKWIPKADRDRKIAAKIEAQRKKIEEAKAHREWRNRYQVESKHFKFQHTLPPEVFADLRDLLEVYYDTFTKKWKIKADPKIGKPPVCLYHDEEYYYQVSGAPRGAIGYFRFVSPIELDLFYERNDPRLTIDVLFHEGNHLLTYMIDPTFMYSPWVNESLAEYYGASQWDPATKTMSVGHVQEGRLVVLWDEIAKGKMRDLEEMIKEERFGAVDYAWGWSFVHFLMETPKYGEKFQKFYIALAKDPKIPRREARPGFNEVSVPDQVDALKRYLGVKDLKTLETEWHEYIKGRLKLTSERGYSDAGKWAWRFDMKLKAKRFFTKAVEGGSANPDTYGTFAEVLVANREYDQAIQMWEKAIELDPLNPEYYVDLGRFLAHGQGATSDERKERGKKLIALAQEMAPDDPMIWMQTQLDELDAPPAPPPAMNDPMPPPEDGGMEDGG